MLPVFKFLKDHRKKIRLWSAWEGDLDLTTADGWKHAIDIVSAAEHSSSRTSERTRRTKQQRAEMGTFSGGRPPFGFCADGVTHHPTEAPLIRRAAREIVEGRSLNSIAVETGVDPRHIAPGDAVGPGARSARAPRRGSRQGGMGSDPGARAAAPGGRRAVGPEAPQRIQAALVPPGRRHLHRWAQDGQQPRPPPGRRGAAPLQGAGGLTGGVGVGGPAGALGGRDDLR